MAVSDHVVNDDLQRPGRGQAHRHLHQHRGQNDGEGSAVRTK
jgi:hypothetical protein